MSSLQRRLATGLVIFPALLMGTILIVGHYALRQLIEEFVATRLGHDMEALLMGLSFDHSGAPMLNPERIDPVFRQPYSGHYYTIRTDGYELRSRSLWDTTLPVPTSKSAAITRYFMTGPQAQELLVLVRTFELRGQSVVMAISEDFTSLSAGLRRLTLGFVIVTLVLLGTLILGQRFIVRQGLKPLDAVRRDLTRLAQGELRLLSTQVPSEIRPLVQEINRLIKLMEQRLLRSRHGLGNLAHALKTPLTVLTQLAEQEQTRTNSTLGGELKRETQKICELMDRELKRARIAGAALPGQQVVLAQEIADLVDTVKKIHRSRDLVIHCQILPRSLFAGERDDLLELLGNLLDNACKWAKSTVRLTVSETSRWQHLTVEDDGPGCPWEQLELLTRRGARIDESPTGSGLGLAIVADIVEQYRGRLRLGRSPQLGGFMATVELPRGRHA